MNNLRNFPPVTLGIFQSTLLQEERQSRHLRSIALQLFQSTLLQEERRDNATPHCRFKNFNPRSYKRSDISIGLGIMFLGDFNPRSYKRSDFFCGVHSQVTFFISIHAPTRGATSSCRGLGTGDCDFNPRSYKRSDTLRARQKNQYKLFQSTLLQEERHITAAEKYVTVYISIHAPTRGATKDRNTVDEL